ncbi:trypsin-like serine protease, partial [Shewanella electrica]|uniref:trypsin-like serine protease n=1 Tax=Shewanella electrica TaxID=515560 RepID=UPI0034DCF5B1
MKSCGSDKTKVCTYAPGKDTCKGDSGGPIAWLDPETNRFTIVGVVSYGPEECGESPLHGVNSNILYYDDWINQTIGSTSSNLK